MDNSKLYIGILSGTSMDSIDCGIYRFSNNHHEMLAFYENEYPSKIKNKINENLSTLQKDYLKSPLNINLANEYGNVINKMLLKESIKNSDIKAIGMHGQTISHTKKNNKNVSIQLGDPNILVEKTNIKVVSDFRNHDIENGGEGAPLAPLFHDYIFKNIKKKRIIVNIGGISNVSQLTNSFHVVSGYDAGPGNILIDSWMRENFNAEYDKDGLQASSHKIIDDLLDVFMDDDYFKMQRPKSTTTEYFCHSWILHKLNLIKKDYSKGDILSTLTMFTALSIIKSIEENYSKCDEIYICGGGAFNITLMSNLSNVADQIFSNKVVVSSTELLDFNPKSVEAGLFAWLAMSRINKHSLDYTNITGSKKPAILGNIYNPR